MLGRCDGFFRLPEEKKSSDTLTNGNPVGDLPDGGYGHAADLNFNL